MSDPSISSCDVLIVGGGVIGIAIGRELKQRNKALDVLIIEKESEVASHASGRNSGVIHAGFYYTADSLKAKFTRDGNKQLKAFCAEHGVPVNACGKLVVAQQEHLIPQLDVLLERAKVNGVELQAISRQEAKEIEPRIKLFGERALWSPNTASVDPKAVMNAMHRDYRGLGGRMQFDTGFLLNQNVDWQPEGATVRTSQGAIRCRYVINCAGLYADQVARAFGLSQNYRILPFKGLYLYANAEDPGFRTNIYPVPDLRNPFLGVHVTVTATGATKIGPTAIPAFWREQYGGMSRFKFDEFVDIALRQSGLFFTAGFDFRQLAFEEIQKVSRRKIVELAGELAEGLHAANFKKWGAPGIRAQLLNTETKALEMDFVSEANDHSLHVLNSVSPAFTCSLPLASAVVDQCATPLGL